MNEASKKLDLILELEEGWLPELEEQEKKEVRRLEMGCSLNKEVWLFISPILLMVHDSRSLLGSQTRME